MVTASVKSSPAYRPGRSLRRRLVSPSPSVVQFEWKLPARLRKPIRQQLAQERRKKQERQAIIRFEKRAIHTQPLLVAGREPKESSAPGITLPKRRFFNRGAEHHTGDTYRYARPQLQVAAPPYVGRGAPRYNVATPKPLMAQRRRESVPSQSLSPQTWLVERDVPFEWEGRKARSAENSEPIENVDQDLFVQVDEDSEIQLPKRFLSIPLSLNIWPINLFVSKKPAVDENSSLGEGGKLERSGVKKNRGESLMASYKRIS